MADRAPADERAYHHPAVGSAVLLTLGALLASGFVGMLVVAALGDEALVTGAAVGKVVAFALFGTLATFRIPAPHDARMGLRSFPARILGPMLLLVPAVFLLSEIDNWLLRWLPLAPELAEQLQEARAVERSPWSLVQQAIVVVGLLPVVDEWFFRGVLQQGLVAHTGHVRGLLLTALLFAPSHASPVPAPGAVLSALLTAVLLGLLLGLLRIASGSVMAPMALHAATNAIALGAMAAQERLPIGGFNVPDSHTSPLLLLGSAVSVALGLRLLWPEVRARAHVVDLPRDAAGPLGPGMFP